MEAIYDFGIGLIYFLQTLSPALDGVMKVFSFFGTIEFYLLLIPLIYWVVDTRFGFRLLLVLITTDFLAMGCKQLLRQPRPYWISNTVNPLADETSYGIASTHASDSLAVWCYLAYQLKKNWLWALAIVLVALIGLSRMYLAVHFPTDVLAGWLIGLTVIVIYVRIEPWAIARLEKLSTGGRIGVGFGASVVIILTGWLINLLTAAIPDPPAWAQYALQARSLTSYFTLGGALFGAAAGYVIMRARLNFQPRGSMAQRAACYLIGTAGVLAIYLGLDLLFTMLAADDTIAGLILRYLRYGAVSFWAIYIAPWVFLKFKLGSQPAGNPALGMAR